MMRRTIFVWVFTVFLQAPVFAQTYRGAINGTVTDPSGAVVPNAAVQATDKATGIERTTITTNDGNFGFQDIPVGTYTVVITAKGFPVLTVYQRVCISASSDHFAFTFGAHQA
jgi:hypothetical protein